MRERERPDILSFTPWDVVGSGAVGDRLLREIATALNHPDASADDRARAVKWEQWAAALNMTAAVPTATPRIAAGALLIAGLSAVGASVLLNAPAFELTIQVVGIVATAIGGALTASATLAERAATFFNARSKRRERTLDALKEELRAAMADRDRQLIVVVDEIDRVPANEMQLLLRAIRTNADFPQVVFFLVFERGVVEKAIADQAHVDGGEYLKKIIQIPFSIPLTESSRVQKVLFRQLNEMFDGLPDNVPFDQRRWGNLFFGGLYHYIETLRDVYRYATTVEFHAGMFRVTGTMEVNQIDLLGLEALRVFEPDVYDVLPQHRRLLLEGPGRSHHDKKEDAQAEFARLLERAPETNREAVKQILAVVFQPIEWLVQNYMFGSGFEEEWQRKLRACSEQHFDRYFLLAVPEDDVSQRDVEAVLAVVADRERLVNTLVDLRERDLLDAMLQRLEAYKEHIDRAAATPFVTALFDVGDGLTGVKGMYDLGASMHAQRIVYWYLRSFPTEAERERVLDAAIRATVGLQLPLHIVSGELRRDKSRQADHLITEARLPDFQALCVTKLRAFAEAGTLRDHSDLGWLLYRWREWTDDAEAREWVASITRDPAGAMALVRSFTQDIRTHGMGDRVATVRPTTKLSDIDAFVDPAVLDAQLNSVPPSAWNGRDAVVLAAFKRAIARRRAGKPEHDLDDDDDDGD